MDHGLTWWRWLLLFLLTGILVGTWLYLNRNRLHPKIWLNPTNQWIQILEKKWLGPKNTIFLLQVEKQFFLLSQTPNGSSWQKLDPIDLKAFSSKQPAPDHPLSMKKT